MVSPYHGRISGQYETTGYSGRMIPVLRDDASKPAWRAAPFGPLALKWFFRGSNLDGAVSHQIKETSWRMGGTSTAEPTQSASGYYGLGCIPCGNQCFDGSNGLDVFVRDVERLSWYLIKQVDNMSQISFARFRAWMFHWWPYLHIAPTAAHLCGSPAHYACGSSTTSKLCCL